MTRAPSPLEPDRPVQPEPQAVSPAPPEPLPPQETAKPAGRGEPVRKPDWRNPERPEDEAGPDDERDAPRGIDTLPRAGQSPGNPDSTEASAAQDDAQPPRYGSKLV